MKAPNFLKFKLPKWNAFKIPALFQTTLSFYSTWKKFLKQFPPESRFLLKTHQHFIVLGPKESGKSDLIEGLIEQSQDLYPFDTVYKENPDIQFYLGPQQVIQELSFSALENKTIKLRKQLIRLWKKLYAKQDPIVLITYNCFNGENPDLKELYKYAQLIAGKISLLTEIRQAPIKVRVALTHLDKVPGYIEFARFLKQQNIDFNISLSSDFESNTLVEQLKSFAEENHSLILTTTSAKDYVKITNFFKQLPLFFPPIEEFLRNLVARISFKESILLDRAFLTSNQEISTSFNVFQWVKQPSRAIFFRYPQLKHQLTSAALYLLSASFLLTSYFRTRHEVLQLQKGVELLNLFQLTTFEKEVVPELENFLTPNYPCFSFFFDKKSKIMKDRLAHRIWKHVIEPPFHKAILESRAEFKHLYFLGLMHASSNEHLKKFIFNNSARWAEVTHIKEDLIKLFINSCSTMLEPSDFYTTKVNPFLPLASLEPWVKFFKKFQELIEQPIIVDAHLQDLMNDIDKFLTAIGRLKIDPIAFSIASLLEEGNLSRDSENIATIQWIGGNIDALENFFSFLRHTSIPPLQVQGMNLSQFFVKIKEISRLSELETQAYNFALAKHVFTFNTTDWIKLILSYDIEQAIQNYITLNTDSSGSIFFQDTFESPEPSFSFNSDSFPYFNASVVIPGRYSRADYEKKVRSTAEKLAVLVESLPINLEEKKRFANFLVKESVAYIKSYQEKYIKFFESCDIRERSIESLKKILNNLTKSSANFYEFLKSVQQQTSIFSDPILSIKNIEELNEFAFLNTILTPQDGVAPISDYQKLLEELLNELEVSTEVNIPDFELLAPHLTPAGRISLNISHNTSLSFLSKTRQVLQKMGVPEKFQETFLKPILHLHHLGLEELKDSLEKIWYSELSPKLDCLLAKFPFNIESDDIASLQDVERFFNPTSAQYHIFKQVIEASCHDREGEWVPIEPDHLIFDQNMYDRFNQVSKISKTLWDKEGMPKPFILKIKSVPFTTVLEKDIFPVLSYLIIGNYSVYNLNQDPDWQPIKIEWWQNDISSVGLELLNRQTKSKSYLTTQTSLTPWSFFALLKQAKQKSDGTWSWNLPIKNGKTKEVSFLFETNPDAILQPCKTL